MVSAGADASLLVGVTTASNRATILTVIRPCTQTSTLTGFSRSIRVLKASSSQQRIGLLSATTTPMGRTRTPRAWRRSTERTLWSGLLMSVASTTANASRQWGPEAHPRPNPLSLSHSPGSIHSHAAQASRARLPRMARRSSPSAATPGGAFEPWPATIRTTSDGWCGIRLASGIAGRSSRSCRRKWSLGRD